MSWIPTKNEIEKEVKNYETLSFLNKSKNGVVIFILIVSSISLFLMNGIDIFYITIGIFNIENYGIIFNLVLAVFIYLNYRWAIALFAMVYLIDKALMISMGASPVSSIIFGALAATLSYNAFCVATELKKRVM